MRIILTVALALAFVGGAAFAADAPAAPAAKLNTVCPMDGAKLDAAKQVVVDIKVGDVVTKVAVCNAVCEKAAKAAKAEDVVAAATADKAIEKKATK
jgi:hypothetical protein